MLARLLSVLASAFIIQAALTAGQGPAAPASGAAAPTFAGEIGPLLQAECGSCHHPGGAAPFSVLEYDEAAPHAQAIAASVSSGAMPPWKPERGYGGPFVNERTLSDDQIRLLQRWAAAGAPRGDGAAAVVPHRHSDWELGTPDLVVTFPESFVLQPGGRDVFRNFAVPLLLESGRYVKGIEFQPTNHRVTHHANLRIDPTAASSRLDARDPLPGYEGITAASAVFPDGHFLGWTPGQVAPFLPDGMSWRIAPGSSLIVEMHLVPTDRPEPVGFRVGLYFTDQPPTRTPVMMRLGRQNIDIPAGASAHQVRDEFRLPVDVEVQSVQPHAHYLAKEVKGYAILPDGSQRWLIWIRKWDFHAQDLYRYVRPVSLPKGTTVFMEYTYDNSAANRWNPSSPPARVRWGQYTTDEMGDLWLQVLPTRPRDFAPLTRSIRTKERAEDLVGLRVLLERRPEDASVHASLAEGLINVGRRDEAFRHLRAHVRLEPNSAVAHYNLATVLAASAQPREAIDEFRRALVLQPGDAPSHNGLGGVLLNAMGDSQGALREFQAAIKVDPVFANAYNNMGVALERLERRPEALIAYLAAVELAPDTSDFRYNAGRLLEAEGRFPEAVVHYRQATVLAPDDPVVRGRLESVLRQCRC